MILTKDDLDEMLAEVRTYMNETGTMNRGIDLLCGNNQPYTVVNCGGSLFDAYINLFEDAYSIPDNWISYYVFECDLGDDPRTVILDGKEYLLDSDSAFFDFLFEVSKR